MEQVDIVAEVMRHARRIAVEIGCRPIGSPAGRAAASYIDQHLRSAGLTVTTQPFRCPDWSEESTYLELGEDSLEAVANAFSPSCDVVAEIVPVCTLKELRNADITGRIPIFYGALTQHELAAKASIYVPDEDREIVELLETRRPAALLTVNPTRHGKWRLVEDFDLAVPSATVTAGAGMVLVESGGRNARLRITSRTRESHSANVIGARDGDGPDRIVLCAHYDTKVDTPGAYDNAAGVAAILTVASILAESPLRHGLEVIAFSGEEGYGLGDMTYAAAGEEVFQSVVAAVNLDGVGPRLATNTVAVFESSEELTGMVDEVVAGHPGVQRVPPWPASDHYIFYSNGVPAVALTSTGTRDIYHTPDDTIDWLSPEKLAEAVGLAEELIRRIDAHDRAWCRPQDA